MISEFVLKSKKDDCRVDITEKEAVSGIRVIKIDIDFGEKKTPSAMKFEFEYPCVDMYSVWHPLTFQRRAIARG